MATPHVAAVIAIARTDPQYLANLADPYFEVAPDGTIRTTDEEGLKRVLATGLTALAGRLGQVVSFVAAAVVIAASEDLKHELHAELAHVIGPETALARDALSQMPTSGNA